VCESVLLVFIGFGGAAFVALMHATGVIYLGIFLLLLATAAGVISLTGLSSASSIFRVWAGALSGLTCALAVSLLLRDVAVIAFVWSFTGLAIAELARRRRSFPLAVQSVAWIFAGALLGGVGASLVNSLVSTSTRTLDFRPEALVIALIATVACARLEERFARGTMLGIAAVGAFSCVVYLAALLVQPSAQSGLALIRTSALAAVAASLALLARFGWAAGAIGLARAFLVLGGLKLLVEDVRIGSALMLVAAFAVYGGAMLVVGRCALRHTRTEQAIQVTEPSDPTMQSAN